MVRRDTQPMEESEAESLTGDHYGLRQGPLWSPVNL